MAPKKDEKKTTDLVETEKPGALAIPDDLKEFAGAGVENIGDAASGDIRPPRLMMAQAGSPQVKRGDPKEIKDLREGYLFNDLTEQIYGDGTKPMKFVVLFAIGSRHIEFAPMEEGGGIIDANVAPNDPRTKFRKDPENPRKSLRPIATKFLDYLVWLPETEEFVSFSFKGTGVKVAVRMNSVMVGPLKLENGARVMDPPSWARTWTLETRMTQDGQFSWAIPVVKGAGVTDPETRALCAGLYKRFHKANIQVPVGDGEDTSDSAEPTGGDASFDPEKL